MASFAAAVQKLCATLPAAHKISDEFFEQINLKSVQLRPYQTAGLQWLIQRYLSRFSGCLLGDDMGLGKTLQSVSFLLYLKSACRHGLSALIVCPLSVTSQWMEELKKVAPSLSVCVYTQGKDERLEQQTHLASSPCDVILTTYEIVLKDSSFLHKYSWTIVIVDEAHRLKNSSSKLHQTLTEFDVQFRLLLTGTPMQNNMDELYSLLYFVCPSSFPLRDMELFSGYYQDTSNKVRVKELHELLEPLLLRRTRKEVLGDLPEKSDVLLYCGMTELQKKQYKAILMKDTSVFSGEGSRTSLMNILMNLRKCANHPYLFDGVEPEPFELGEHLIESSGKLYVIDRLLDHLKLNGHRVLIFSQMTRMLDIIQDYLGYRGYSYERLDGSVRGEERFIALQNFQSDEDTFTFLLSTKAGGVGLNLVGADTVLFVDSDFNPQNDLQAAARAHRIGQTRAVRVIRLVARNTVDEVIIKRAAAKLELTNAVIESGQFSGLESTDGKTSVDDLVEMLKYGLGSLLKSTESCQEKINFEEILGKSENGEWLDSRCAAGKGSRPAGQQVDDNIYMFEGQDYSKLTSEVDNKMLEDMLGQEIEDMSVPSGPRVLRSENKDVAPYDIPSVSRKRKTWTPEELAERKKKREETKAKKLKLLEEKRQRIEEEKLRRKMELWKENGYQSTSLEMESDDDDDYAVEEAESCDLGYLRGDVTHPQCHGNEDALILHCVDNSGRWGRGGVFSALSSRSTAPEQQYELAFKMKDLHLGDAHMIPVDDRESREQGRDYAVLIVAQSRNNEGRLSGIQLSALDDALKKIAKTATDMKASVHLPRIGYSLPNFNWYGTERLLRKHLSSRGIQTFIYYFPRSGHSQKPKPTGKPAPVISHANDPGGQELLDPLPDIFVDVSAFLCGCGSDDRMLMRYIVAYGGDVCSCIEEGPTHIICDNERDLPEIPGECVVVRSKWILECVQRQALCDPSLHKLKRSL